MIKNSLHTELTLWKDAETFTVTRQVDHDIEHKVDRKTFRDAALSIGLPKMVTDLEFIFITLICQANDKGKNEIWEYEGGAYVTIAIPYLYGREHSIYDILQCFIDIYKDLIGRVKIIVSNSDLEED